MKNESTDELTSAFYIQNDQLNKSEQAIGNAISSIVELQEGQAKHEQELDELEAQIELLMSNNSSAEVQNNSQSQSLDDLIQLSQEEIDDIENKYSNIATLESVDVGDDWESYLDSVRCYASKNNIDLKKDHLHDLLSPSEILEIEKNLKEEYTLKKPHCDKYDYMIASACGAIGGLIDVLFVGIPGKGVIGKFTDEKANSLIKGFAKLSGWNGANEGADPTKSAIGFLERKFKINYDQTNSEQLGNQIRMIPKNHHLKSLGHSPDVVGLFFSILNQFTSTSSFISDGRIITINTESFELEGGNFIAKIFAGFVNWLGHIFSDLGGCSGSAGRGSGVPIPFYNLFLLMDFGSFGENRLTFSRMAVKVFEEGYDLRHGAAMAIPVIFTELSIRVMWTAKSVFYHKNSWKESIPSTKVPELRRMLFIGHGFFCAIDITDAAFRSGGECIQFFLRMNLIAWIRFGHLGAQELRAYLMKDVMDLERLDDDLDKELKELLI